MFLILLMYFCIAASFTIGKTALDFVDPMFLIGVRMMLAGTVLLAYQRFVKKRDFSIKMRDSWLFVYLAVVGITLSYGAEFWAMKQALSSVKTTLLFNLSPFVTALLAYFILHERLSVLKVIGLIIGFVGMMPILIAETPAEHAVKHIGFLSIPELVLLFSVVTYAHGWIVFKQLSDREYSPPFINGVIFLGGGALSLIVSFLFEGFPPIVAPSAIGFASPFYQSFASIFGPSLGAIGIVLFYISLLILIANVFAYNVYGHLLKSYSTTFLSFAGFSTPIFGALLGWFFRSETVTWHFWLSVFLVSVGLYLFYKDESKE